MSDFILQEVKGQFSDNYQDQTIKSKSGKIYLLAIQFQNINIPGAIHRYYESRRRLFNDNKPAGTGRVRENKKNAQKKAYQKRVRYRRFAYALTLEFTEYYAIDV